MPGTTGAVAYFKPSSVANLMVNGKTGAVIQFSPRQVSGPFSQIGVASSADEFGLKAWLPKPSVPIGYVMVDGKKLPVKIDEQAWYKFFYFVANIKLGGPDGATVPDIAGTIMSTQMQTAGLAVNVTTIGNQANANADILSTTIQVAANNNLAGAGEIPPPVVVVNPRGTDY